MTRRPFMILAAAIGGFVATVVVIVLYWATGPKSPSCASGECLEGVAVLMAAIFGGSLVAAACGFLAFVWTSPSRAQAYGDPDQ